MVLDLRKYLTLFILYDARDNLQKWAMILLLPLLYHKAVAPNQGGYRHLAGKTRDAVDTLLIQCTGQPPRQRVTWPQMSTVPMLSRPA